MSTQAEVRAMTARIRQALRHLPSDIREGADERVRNDLLEIVGAASAIAELLEIEL